MRAAAVVAGQPSRARCAALGLLAFAVFSCGAGGRVDSGQAAPDPAGTTAAGTSSGAPPPGANRLARESSPYLLLHAHNPVDWYPWGEEALAKARAENKPIFLSVGYSTCYWCHVMERDVFSSAEIAALMNQWFVNVKVDREERPDLDEVYMTASQLLTGGGGWPNSVFLTPELKPFYAGTYFPAEDKFGRPGFPTVLRAIHDAWQARRGDVEAQAGQVAAAMSQVLAAERTPAAKVPGPERARAAASQLAATYDAKWGGFGGAPKFPGPGNLFLLWAAGAPGSDEHRMVADTLRHMGRGGIYDQVGGGFHRYSTDERWLVPHFEKMLYDNAHLAELLALAWQETRDPDLERLARGTLDFVLREMTLAEGAFKSAIDAETDGEEGAYYVWTAEELRAALGAGGFALLAPIYGFDGAPTFEGERYVLHLSAPLGEHARRLGISRTQLLDRLEPDLERLLAARTRRKRPLVDDKVLTDWNGMMIAAMARAGATLGEPRYVRAAAQAAEFVLGRLDPKDGPLRHAWRNGEPKLDAFLDDYAFFVRGLLALHEATREARWLAAAVRLMDELEQRLAAPNGGYYLAAPRPGLLFQPLSVTDGALPSGNAVAIHDLLALGELTGEPRFRERAERNLRAFSRELEQYPGAVATLAAAVVGDGRSTAATPVASREAAPTQAGAGALDELARQVVETVATVGERAGDWRPLEVRLRIRKGWHVNANPASEDFLIPTRVEGEVRGIQYPAGKPFRFAFSESPLEVYEGDVALRGEVAAGAASVSVTYQACDEKRCLRPVTRAVPLGGRGRR